MPPAHWMNDPNGPVWYQGKYHLFYQHNPNGDTWGDIHWGHTQSSDLVNWEHLPIALYPSTDAGELHCFSGCVVIDGDTPTLFYTSVGEGKRDARSGAVQCMARGDASLSHWKKNGKPVLTSDIHKERIMEWRDPFVWKENGSWYMVLGGSRNGYGVILLYKSADLEHWRYVNILLENQDTTFLECPNLLSFGDKKVLVYSPSDEVVYHIGTIDAQGVFITEHTGILDHSGRYGFYAPNTLLNDPHGRLIMWGWVTEECRGGLQIAGYNGALSLPRELSLGSEGNLEQRLIPEIDTLHEGEPEEINGNLNNSRIMLKTRSRAFDMRLHTECSDDDDFYINLLETPDNTGADGEKTRIHYSAKTNTVTLEKGQTSLSNEPFKNMQQCVLSSKQKTLDMRIILDHSIIEIFVNNQETITGRLYPTRIDADGLSISGKVCGLSLKLWQMRGASPNIK
jgi:beta-fructofuranosidase